MAKFPASLPADSRSHDLRRTVFVAIAILAVLLAIYGLMRFIKQKTKSTSTINAIHAVPNFVATPRSFNDFQGVVSSVNAQSVTMTMPFTDDKGKIIQKQYVATVDAKTELKTVVDRTTTADTVTDLKLADLRTGDLVHAYAPDNLYSLTSFTASRLYRIVK